MSAKKMIAKERASQQIADEFSAWVRVNRKAAPTGSDAFTFYNFLRKERPYLLQFKGSNWNEVHGMLLRKHLVSD